MKMDEAEVRKRLLRYETILDEAPQISRAVKQVCRDAENGIIDIQLKDSYSGTLYLNVIAPALIGFVEWVLEKSVKEGKNRLYFLSRDGWQMYLIARKMVEEYGLSIECRYLNVSRYSMKLPAYYMDIDAGIDSICVGGIDVTPQRILRRAAFTDAECAVTMEEIDAADDTENILNYRDVLVLREKLKHSRNVRQFIQEHSAAAYNNAIGYLIQEGLCRDGNYYLVDSGWIGTLQCSIEKMVQSINPEIKVEGCYFGMYEYPPDADRQRFNTYYFSPKGDIRNKLYFSNSLFETIVSSEEGMTYGYEQSAESYVPTGPEKKNPNEQQMCNNLKILEYLLNIISFDRCGAQLIDRKTIYKLFRLFMAEPTQLELAAYGNNLFSDNVLDDGYNNVAAKLDIEQIKDQRFMSKLLIILGIKKKKLHESAWLEGSAVRAYADNPEKLEKEFRHIRFYKSFVYLKKQMKVW